MIFRDLVETGLGNLWRMKLRATLTLLGVVIAIGAFVAMLSFGAGMQKQISGQFHKLGLLFTIQVYPERETDENRAEKKPPLDDSAMVLLSQLPGVQLVYPFDEYTTNVTYEDTVVPLMTQSLSTEALRTKMFSRIKSGQPFESDSSKEAIVTDKFLDKLEIKEPDSVLGKQIVVSVEVASFDGGLVHILRDGDETLWKRLKEIRIDSMRFSDYRNRILTREMGAAAGRFIDGFLNARFQVSDTLTIAGVMQTGQGGSRIQPLIVPLSTGRKFSQAGFTGNITDLISTLSSGSLVNPVSGDFGKTYSRITLDITPGVPHKPIMDSVKTLGYRAFSYAQEFEEMTRFFAYFDLGLGVIGLIALFVASLGIINTMIMSITERRREIGVMKSLGADEREIKIMFLVESSLIGSIGAVGGIILGWVISRVASFIVQTYMEKQGVDPIDVFSLPVWLVASAFGLGLLVSLIAGYYPSARAAKVDPVEALRYE